MSSTTLERRSSQLTKGRMPSYMVWVVLGAAIVLGAAVAAVIGFNVFLWAVLSAVFFVIAAGLVLFVITLAVNIIARLIIARHKEFSGAN